MTGPWGPHVRDLADQVADRHMHRNVPGAPVPAGPPRLVDAASLVRELRRLGRSYRTIARQLMLPEELVRSIIRGR